MMVQISAIPINYDLVVKDNEKYEYIKGFSYPLIGDGVYILNAKTVGDMYNNIVCYVIVFMPEMQKYIV
jgi:hypothetical protein